MAGFQMSTEAERAELRVTVTIYCRCLVDDTGVNSSSFSGPWKCGSGTG
jgi:hypothetical protein